MYRLAVDSLLVAFDGIDRVRRCAAGSRCSNKCQYATATTSARQSCISASALASTSGDVILHIARIFTATV